MQYDRAHDMLTSTRVRVRPLLARPGARFHCFSQGGCCSDIHRLGPLDARDVARLGRHGASAAIFERVVGEPELRCNEDGRCTLLRDGLCSLHVAAGVAAKPSICRRFPFSLVATPLGGRVVTSHRCPCRSMGPRPALSVATAEASLLGPDGHLARMGDAPARVQLTPRTSVSFASYAELEVTMLARLAKGEPGGEVLGAAPGLPALLDGASWPAIAESFRAHGAYPLRGYQAMAWFGDGILLALGEAPPPRARPWSVDFDHAEARSPDPEPQARVIGDWLADLIWDLSWLAHGAFDRARVSVASLAVLTSAVARRITELGVRPDRAAAEAVLVAEIAAGHPLWGDVVARLPPAAGVRAPTGRRRR